MVGKIEGRQRNVGSRSVLASVPMDSALAIPPSVLWTAVVPSAQSAEAVRERWIVNHKKIQRLWRDEGLRVPQRRRRKRLGTSTTETVTADAPNQVWAVDFQFDATTDGRPVKIVAIVDEHTRECLGGLVERSITADRLANELDRVAMGRGYPAVCAATTALNWPARRCGTGPANASAWRSSHPASPGATATSNRSTADSATNA